MGLGIGLVEVLDPEQPYASAATPAGASIRTTGPSTASTSSVASRDLPIRAGIYGSPDLVSSGPVTVPSRRPGEVSAMESPTMSRPVRPVRPARSARPDFVHSVVSLVTPAAMVVGGVALLTESDTGDSGDVLVAGDDRAWQPDDLTVAVGATLHVDNRDPSHHTLAIEGTDLIVSLPGNRARDLELDGLVPGVYDHVCTVPGHEPIAGTIEVTE